MMLHNNVIAVVIDLYDCLSVYYFVEFISAKINVILII